MLVSYRPYYKLTFTVVATLTGKKTGAQKLKITDSFFWINHINFKTNTK